MASVTVALTGYAVNPQSLSITWSDDISLGSTFDSLGQNQTLSRLALFPVSSNFTPAGQVDLSLVDLNDRFTPAFEATGRIIITASDGMTLEVTIGNADMSEPYGWLPTNFAEVITFANHIQGLADHTAMLTLTDEGVANQAPVITAIAANPTTVASGEVVTLTATVTDPNIP